MSTNEAKLKHPKEVGQSAPSSISYSLKSAQTLYTISLVLLLIFIGVVRSIEPGNITKYHSALMILSLPLSLLIFCKATKRFIAFLKEKNGDTPKKV